MPTDWTLRSHRPDHLEGWQQLRREFDLHPLAARMLVRRGYSSPEAAESFLRPRLRDMHDPHSMADMEDAVGRLVKAVEDGDSVALHGDYDVDGLVSTALLYLFLEKLGADVSYYIPERLEDGYGLDVEAVEMLANDGADLLVTLDCGTTAHEPLAAARERGLDTVVVDHHQPESTRPDCAALLNPVRDDCDFPFEGLAASGVTFNLLVALRAALRDKGWFDDGEPSLKSLLDLVAIGTVADVVPLEDENRTFVQYGLRLLAEGRRPGVASLMSQSGASRNHVTCQTIGYDLAPRLNAAGRLGDASVCVELLTTDDRRRARKIAQQLEGLNDRRREIQTDVLAEARDEASAQRREGAAAVVVDGTDWHRGVLGIVAGRLSDEFHCPVVCLADDDGTLQGSARSIEGVDMVALLDRLDDLLDQYGGHAAAAGLRLGPDRLEEFRGRLDDEVLNLVDGERPPPRRIGVEECVQLGHLDRDFVASLDALRPFGEGNPEPVLACREVVPEQPEVVGDDHLKAEFTDGTGRLKGIGFSMADQKDLLEEPVAAAFVPRWSVFRGRGQLELHLRDLQPSDGDPFDHG